MKRRYIFTIAIVAVVAIAIAGISVRHEKLRQWRASQLLARHLEEFASLQPIDAHTHIFRNASDFTAMLARLHVHVLDILYVDDTDQYFRSLEAQHTDAWNVVNSSQDHARLCTTIDPFAVTNAASAKASVAGLNQDFARGAIAVKIWKNVGMEILDQSGKYVMPDDPRFEEIYRDIASHNKTLIIHAGDPDEAWGIQSPWGFVSKYYDSNPQWNMSLKQGAPKRKDILDAVDRVLARHPDLRVIGAHFASLEDHLDELAPRLDRYPNLAVDTAARVPRLVFQPREKVRDFILKYQDRVVYGTDRHLYVGTTDPGSVGSWEAQYARDWRYFATGDTFEYLGHRVEGLNLPRSVLKKLYRDNAIRWIPGIVGASQ